MLCHPEAGSAANQRTALRSHDLPRPIRVQYYMRNQTNQRPGDDHKRGMISQILKGRISILLVRMMWFLMTLDHSLSLVGLIIAVFVKYLSAWDGLGFKSQANPLHPSYLLTLDIGRERWPWAWQLTLQFFKKSINKYHLSLTILSYGKNIGNHHLQIVCVIHCV